MLQINDLQALRKAAEYRKNKGFSTVLSPEEVLAVIDQAIEDRSTINRWYGFLKLMAQRSSWRNQIQSLLDDYLYGTADESVKKAAQTYLERSKLHNRE